MAPLERGQITLGLDGLSALKQAQAAGSVDPTLPSADLIEYIRHERSNLPVEVKFRWVEGHLARF